MSDRDMDYEHILTQLYSRKATRKAFKMIEADFKKATNGHSLCKVIREAQTEIIRDIDQTTSGKKGAEVRTKAFKLIDYSTWLRFCDGEKE